jgi:hypothetical protein
MHVQPARLARIGEHRRLAGAELVTPAGAVAVQQHLAGVRDPEDSVRLA